MRNAAMFVALLFTVTLMAAAGDSPRGPVAGKTTNVQVWGIRATTKNKEVSPELKSIADQLRKQFKYTGFKLEKRAAGTTEQDKAFKTALFAGYEASVTPKENDGKRVKLQIQVQKDKETKPKIDTTVSINAGEWQLSGGWDVDGGDALIVGVSAR